MKTLIVEIAGLRFTDDRESTLVTYALGSCIAVTAYEPVLRVGGMIHYMLPMSTASPDKAAEKPAMFADTGIPLLFEGMYARGAKKENLIVCVIGGAQVHDDEGVFNIGKRNYTVLRKMFWKNGVIIAAEHVGGSESRTVYLDIETGRISIRLPGREEELWKAGRLPSLRPPPRAMGGSP